MKYKGQEIEAGGKVQIANGDWYYTVSKANDGWYIRFQNVFGKSDCWIPNGLITGYEPPKEKAREWLTEEDVRLAYQKMHPANNLYPALANALNIALSERYPTGPFPQVRVATRNLMGSFLWYCFEAQLWLTGNIVEVGTHYILQSDMPKPKELL